MEQRNQHWADPIERPNARRSTAWLPLLVVWALAVAGAVAVTFGVTL